jgi:hypothetical protein
MVAALTQFACEEAGQPQVRELIGDMPDDRGLAAAGRAGEQDVT